MKRVSLITAIIGALIACMIVYPPVAIADPPSMDSVIDDPANWGNLEDLVQSGSVGDPVLYSQASGGLANAEEIIAEMEAAGSAGTLAALPGVLTIGVSGIAAGYFGYKIGSVIDHWLPHREWLGNTVDIPFSSWTGLAFVGENCNGASFVSYVSPPSEISSGINGSHIPLGCTYSSIVQGRTGTYRVYEVVATGRGSNWDDQGSTGSSPTCTGSTDCNLEAFLQRLPSVDPKIHFLQYDDITHAHQCGVGVHCWLASDLIYAEDFAREIPPSGPVTTTNPGGTTTATAYPATPASVSSSSTQATAVRTIIKSNTITETYVVHILDPTDFPTNPIADLDLPKPDVNETYTAYIARLAALGFVGTITDVTETNDLSGYGPNAVTRVIDTTASPSRVFDPLLWPSTDPIIHYDHDFTIRHNSSSATPQPTETPTQSNNCGTTADPCVITDPTTGPEDGTDCSTCAIDWTPIESLDVGTKFPFGVPTWFHDLLGGYTFDGDCRTLSIGKPAALGGGSIDIPFCSTSWEDTYRPIVFPILEALMTIAGVTFLGVKIFGMGGESD